MKVIKCIKWWFFGKEIFSPMSFLLTMLRSGLTFGTAAFIILSWIYPNQPNQPSIAFFVGFISFLMGLIFPILWGWGATKTISLK